MTTGEWRPTDEFRAWLDRSIEFLEAINSDPEKRRWCETCDPYLGSNDLEFERKVDRLIEGAYEHRLVVTDYHDHVDMHDDRIYTADPEWLGGATMPQLLSAIACHYRKDHFCNGSIVNESIASGAAPSGKGVDCHHL